MTKIIDVKNMTFKYNDKTILNDISFSVEEGKWVSIVGPNGSGKSTLVRILTGLLGESEDITICGMPLIKKNFYEIRKSIGMVFENPDNNLLGETVLDDLSIILENLYYEEDIIDRETKKVLKAFDIEHLKDVNSNNLSGGEKQKVALAAAMIHTPKIIILDEAIEMIDDKSRKEILELLKIINRAYNTTIIMVTHDLNEALYGDEIILLANKEILMTGNKLDCLKEEAIFKKLGFELPFMIDLSSKLRSYGLVSDVILDMNEMVNTLWQ